jgi:hypothetical protein
MDTLFMRGITWSRLQLQNQTPQEVLAEAATVKPSPGAEATGISRARWRWRPALTNFGKRRGDSCAADGGWGAKPLKWGRNAG